MAENTGKKKFSLPSSFSLLNSFKGDRAIWIIFFFLTVASLVSVFSSIGYEAVTTHRTPGNAFFRHTMFVIATYLLVIILSNFDYRRFAPASWIGYLLSVVLLIVAFVLGHEDAASGSGMGRWIRLPLVGRFQPSEFAKVVLVVYLARTLAMKKTELREWKVFRNIVLTTLLVVALIFPQNFSTAAIIAVICFVMMRIAPVDARHWRLTVIGLVAFGLLLVFLGSHFEIPYLSRANTWSSRVDKWLNFDEDELSQESMARMAVASGRFFGVGVGSTVQARLMTQANNDMIYSIIIEETGMLGGISVFLLYLFLYIRCMRVAWRCKGDFGRMTVFGLGTMIFLQACIHMSVSVGAMPVTGQTLPLISSGGTAYLCTGMAVGIIQSVAFDQQRRTENVHSKTESEEKLKQ
ncbi:MAG: FtsW/RodA/SpoVE family cell cycle protein [Bacteroidales bacterium]|nr:FtsW/RodA/SpoVE family cell cycle protein [Bacteroidales bacterium]